MGVSDDLFKMMRGSTNERGVYVHICLIFENDKRNRTFDHILELFN
jgi:hypothetical protein